MRFAVLLAVVAALWVQPAKAVTTALYFEGYVTSFRNADLPTFGPNLAVGNAFTATIVRNSTGHPLGATGSGSLTINGFTSSIFIDPTLGVVSASVSNGSPDRVSGQIDHEDGLTLALNVSSAINNIVESNDPNLSLLYYVQDGDQAGGGWFSGTQYAVSLRPTLVRVGSPVPEPATWAMMLLGFGAMGWGMRRHENALASA